MEIELDPAIRDWVLLPLMLVLFLMGLLRNNVAKLMRKDIPTKRADVERNNTLMRARRLRANARFLPPAAFAMRKRYFIDDNAGVLNQKIDAPNPMSMMEDPNVMMNMMQGNFAMMVPQIVMMQIINYFFSGFVLGKVPFPLTPSFKGMLQRGIGLTTLDTSYVTSLSWYFLVMFGMRGLYSIVLGAGAETDDARMMQAQMGMGGAQPGQPVDFKKLFAAEAENMQITEHTFLLMGAEDKFIATAGARQPVGGKQGKQD